MLRCDSFRGRAMKNLVDCTGKIVYVNYVEAGIPSLAIGEMSHVSRFDFIMVQSTEIMEDSLNAITNASHFKEKELPALLAQ